MNSFNSVEVRKKIVDGRKEIVTNRVVIQGKTRFKQSTVVRKGKKTTRRTCKKKLTKKELDCIMARRFIPGLFDECVRSCLDEA